MVDDEDLQTPHDDEKQSLAESEPFPGVDSAESMALGLSLYHQHVRYEFERGITFVHSLAGNLRYTEKRLPTSRKERLEIAKEVVQSLEEWAYHSLYPQYWMDLGARGLTTQPPDWINLTLTRAYCEVSSNLRLEPQAVWFEPNGLKGGAPHWHQATAKLVDWVSGIFANNTGTDRPVMKITRIDENGGRVGAPFLVRYDAEMERFDYPANMGLEWIPVHNAATPELKILPHLTWLKKNYLETMSESVVLRRDFIRTRLDQEFAAALPYCYDDQWRRALAVNQTRRLSGQTDSAVARIDRLKPTEKKVYDIICRSARRMNTNQVLSAMMASSGPSGESNTKAALANLVAIDLLTNARDELGQGYAPTNRR